MNNDNPKMQAALAKFPGTFGLKAFDGTFRVSPSSSYLNDEGVPMLYTEIENDGTWLSFCKGTVQELDAAIVRKEPQWKNKVVRHWEIVERADGRIEVSHNPKGRIGTGDQELAEPTYLYQGTDMAAAIEAIEVQAFTLKGGRQ